MLIRWNIFLVQQQHRVHGLQQRWHGIACFEALSHLDGLVEEVDEEENLSIFELQTWWMRGGDHPAPGDPSD